MSDESLVTSPFLEANVIASLLYSVGTRLPSLKSALDYPTSFAKSAETSEAFELISNLNNTRKNMEMKLNSPVKSLGEIESSIVDYLPYLYKMLWSLKAQPKVMLQKATNFDWRGSFTTNDNLFRMTIFAYELNMCLHALVSTTRFSFFMFAHEVITYPLLSL